MNTVPLPTVGGTIERLSSPVITQPAEQHKVRFEQYHYITPELFAANEGLLAHAHSGAFFIPESIYNPQQGIDEPTFSLFDITPPTEPRRQVFWGGVRQIATEISLILKTTTTVEPNNIVLIPLPLQQEHIMVEVANNSGNGVQFFLGSVQGNAVIEKQVTHTTSTLPNNTRIPTLGEGEPLLVGVTEIKGQRTIGASASTLGEEIDNRVEKNEKRQAFSVAKTTIDGREYFVLETSATLTITQPESLGTRERNALTTSVDKTIETEFPSMRIEAVTIANPTHRHENQDNLLIVPRIFPNADLLMVADGFGGETAGAKASRLASIVAQKYLERAPRPKNIEEARLLIQHAMIASSYALGEAIPNTQDSDTTIAIGLLYEDRRKRYLITGNVGDATIDIIRKQGAEYTYIPATTSDTVLQRWVRRADKNSGILVVDQKLIRETISAKSTEIKPTDILERLSAFGFPVDFDRGTVMLQQDLLQNLTITLQTRNDFSLYGNSLEALLFRLRNLTDGLRAVSSPTGSHEFHTSITELQKGDAVIFASDALADNYQPREIINFFGRQHIVPAIAKEVNQAFKDYLDALNQVPGAIERLPRQRINRIKLDDFTMAITWI